jgi:uncharacterized protein YbjT (DUF2867 family)
MKFYGRSMVEGQHGVGTVLVIGATGRTGRHVVDGLLERGVDVRALVRHAPTAGLPERVTVIRGSLEDGDAVTAAATGADAAFLLWPGFDSTAVPAVIDALAARVGHIVYLSAAQLQEGRSGVPEGIWADVEAAVEGSGATWTFLRAGGFAANTLEWAEALRTGDVVRAPFPDAARPLVHERDVAEVAVRALLDRNLAGRAVEITGSEPLTQRQQVATIGAVLGRDLRVEQESMEEARARYTATRGAGFAESALAHWADLVERPEQVRDGVQQVLGRSPRSYAEWVGDHAEEFTPRTTAEVGQAYADALARGDLPAAGRLLADDVIRVAPLGTGGRAEPVQGLAAIHGQRRGPDGWGDRRPRGGR